MLPTAPPHGETSDRLLHPRVMERNADGIVTITLLAPRNPFRIDNVTPLVFGPVFLAAAALLAWIIFGRSAGIVPTLLAMLACGIAWFAIELPTLLRGLHTRVDIAVTPDEFCATVRHLWSTRLHAYRRDQVLGARIVSTTWANRALHVRFIDGEPLEIMAGFPDDHIDAAADALRRALRDVVPTKPVLRADDVSTLPYAGAGQSYEVEVRRLTDGAVSVVVPPPIRNASRTLGSVIFGVMWLVMFGLLFRLSWRGLWWCPFIPLTLIGGAWALAVSVRDYLRRNEPLVIVRTRDELVIENAPRFRKSRRIPRGEIRSIECGPSGKERRFVLLIKAKREIELMVGRETDEIERVVAALNESS